MRDPPMHIFVALTIAIPILHFMKFEVPEKDFPDFLARLPARFVALPWLHSKHSITCNQPQRERSDGVGLGRLGGIFS